MNIIEVSSYRPDNSRATIQNNNGAIRLIFTVNSKRYLVNIGLSWTSENLKIAEDKALQITQDILFNRFDGNLDQYKVGYNPQLVLISNKSNLIILPNENKFEPNLKELWEFYKQAKINDVSIATKRNKWRLCDKIISLCQEDIKMLELDYFYDLISYLLTDDVNSGKGYSKGYLLTAVEVFSTAINFCNAVGKYQGIRNVARQLLRSRILDNNIKKTIKVFTKDDVKIILNAFKTNQFWDSKQHLPEYYTFLVEFRFLTGCRPSEAIALTWNDIIINCDKVWIRINKRYVLGELKKGTKNGIDVRLIPCYPQLLELINSLPRIENKSNLIFPSAKEKTYINSGNFSKRYWLKIVGSLFNEGLISQYLSFYDQRHTTGTYLVRSGVDIKTVSTILGNSPETLMKNYLANNDDLSCLPPMF